MVKINTDFGAMSVIDGSNYMRLADDSSTRELRGYQGRNYERYPFGSMPWQNMPMPVIPRSEWSGLIKEGNANKTFALHHHQHKKVPILNQRQTPYCWVNAVTGAIMNARAMTGYPTVHLSSASAGAPGKNYRSEGGWTGEAIGYIEEYGLAPHSMWPNDAIDRRYFDSTREIAKQFGIGQWWELKPKRFDEIMTCLLLGYPVCVGLLWWGHAVFYAAPVEISRNVYGVVCVNSWGDQWESGGMSVLAEEKANADEANCVTTAKVAGDDDSLKRLRAFRESLRGTSYSTAG